MRLKTQTTEEAPPRYTRLTPIPTTGVALETAPRRQKVVEPQPLVYPKRLVGICAAFVATLGVFHLLSVNSVPPRPTKVLRAQPTTYSPLPQAQQYLEAASALLSWSHGPSNNRAWLRENPEALALVHQAVTKKADGAVIDFLKVNSRDLQTLVLTEYEVALAEGKRAQAISALETLIRLKALTQVISFRETERVGTVSLERLAFVAPLREGHFTAPEAARLHTALESYLAAEPDWAGLAQREEARVLHLLYSLTTETDRSTVRVNWDHVVNGSLLSEKSQQIQDQLALLRYGSQGVYDSYQHYVSALAHRVALPPQEAATVVVPPVVAFPSAKGIEEGLTSLAEARQSYAALRQPLRELQKKLESPHAP